MVVSFGGREGEDVTVDSGVPRVLVGTRVKKISKML